MLSVTFIKAAIGEGPFMLAPSGGVGVWLLDGEVDEEPAEAYPVEFIVILSASDWFCIHCWRFLCSPKSLSGSGDAFLFFDGPSNDP